MHTTFLSNCNQLTEELDEKELQKNRPERIELKSLKRLLLCTFLSINCAINCESKINHMKKNNNQLKRKREKEGGGGGRGGKHRVNESSYSIELNNRSNKRRPMRCLLTRWGIIKEIKKNLRKASERQHPVFDWRSVDRHNERQFLLIRSLLISLLLLHSASK